MPSPRVPFQGLLETVLEDREKVLRVGPAHPQLRGLGVPVHRQRGRPGFGALADKSIAHLRRHWDGDGKEPTTYLLEVNSDGRRLECLAKP
jgi:hypothetical protein